MVLCCPEALLQWPWARERITQPPFHFVFKTEVSRLFQKIMQHLEREGLKNVIFTNCVKDENIKQVGFSCFVL